MPTAPSDPRRSRRVALAALLVAALVAGCSGDDEPSADPGASPRAGAAAEAGVDAPDVARALTRLLGRRADAVRAGDAAAFEAGVDRRDRGFASLQQAYLANLEALPLGDFGYRLDRGSLVREGKAYWAEVDVTLELDGFDRVPVVTRDRYLFRPGPGGGYRLASMTDAAWEETHGVDPQPWESGPLTVRSGTGVLGLFDAGSAAAADQVMREVEAGVADVAAQVPYDWDRRVVVYALADPDFLSRLDNVPGGDALALDAVTFPVQAEPGSSRIAATRFVLNPRMLSQPPLSRGRLIRHELTHVALGRRQDGIPTWFSEGLAEYVSVQPLAPEQRAVSGAALAAAKAGPTSLPGDDTFNGEDSVVHYGLAWWACEYLAETYDESMLWVLLDAMAGEDADEVLQNVLQLDEASLARKSAKLMVSTYDPEPSPEPSPESSPESSEEPSPAASDDPSDQPSDGSSDGPSDKPSSKGTGG